eukprot:8275025-Ditylum_brightwellii.AAC.1
MKALLKQHVKHFSQAGTDRMPFTTGPLFTLGKYAKTELGQLFRNTKTELPYLQLDKYTTEFGKELKRTKEDLPGIDTTIATMYIEDNYKNWKENTSTSPEG